MSSQINPGQFSNGEPVSKSALRDTFSTIKSELEHGGFTQVAPDAPMRRVSDRLGDMITVKDFDAVGDGVVDDTSAIQAAINSNRAIYFPAGVYRITSALTYTHNQPLIFVGESGNLYSELNGGAGVGVKTVIQDGRGSAETDEPMLHRVEGWQRADGTFTDGQGGEPSFPAGRNFELRHIMFGAASGNKNSSCVEVHQCRSGYFENCEFAASFRGLNLAYGCFDVTVINCYFRGAFFASGKHDWSDPAVKIKARMGWGLYADSLVWVYGMTATNWGCAAALTGAGCSIFGGRFETNAYGMILGVDRYVPLPDDLGNPLGGTLTRSCIHGVSLEANTIAIEIKNAAAFLLEGVAAQGSPRFGDRPDSEIGLLNLSPGTTARVRNCTFGGTFTKGAIINKSRIALHETSSSNSGNAPNITGWQQPFLKHSADAPPFYHFLNSQNFPNATFTRHRTLTAFHDLMLPGLSGVNIRDLGTSGDSNGGPIFSKNLGGTVAPANAATTAAVSFFTEIGRATIGFSGTTPEAIADAGSTLAPGTYYYATTVIAPHGEVGVAYGTAIQHNHKTVVVGSGEKARMTFFGTNQTQKRRIYRASVQGEFGGYWEQEGHSTFEDTGQPFDGYAIPPEQFAIPARVEDNANYQIVATPSWATTVHVTGKTTTGFMLNFGTPAPDANQIVAWLMFRP